MYRSHRREKRPRRRYTTGDTAVDSQLKSLVSSFGDERDQRLLVELLISGYRLGKDRATTGDLKVLNAALKELRHAFKIFKPYRHVRKVAIFGSARLKRSHTAYSLAQRYGHLMAQAGWMVITGAASGIMRAGHEGAGRDASFGLNIRLPFEQEANEVIASDEKLVTCKYFFTRKLLFIKESHATVLFPGGFGTLDEGFESLTLVQTGKSDPRPIVFVDVPGGRFWKPLLNFINRQLVRQGMISPSDHSIYQTANSAKEAAQKTLEFYDGYHSLRYVGDYLVMRLKRWLQRESVSELARSYRDILISGSIEQRMALPEEADEPEIAHLPRLVFRFNRREHGRLFEMIHAINALSRLADTAVSKPRKS